VGVSGKYHGGYHGFQGELNQGTLKSTPTLLTKNLPSPLPRGCLPLGGLLPFRGLPSPKGPPPPLEGPFPLLGGQIPLP
jgi:hypothetical protein